MTTAPGSDDAPATWAEAEEQTAEFRALLAKYDGDYQQAVDAQRRGERADPEEGEGSANPM
jgi:hypothetical protein